MEQTQATWQPVIAVIRQIAQQTAPTAAGVAITSGLSGGTAYIANAAVSNAVAILINSSERDLQSVRNNTEALVQAPYRNATMYLEDARSTTNAERRVELIDKASDQFRQASANFNQRGEGEENLFLTAKAETYFADCSAFLGRFDEARAGYRRAHTAVTRYLNSESSSVGKARKKLERRLASIDSEVSNATSTAQMQGANLARNLLGITVAGFATGGWAWAAAGAGAVALLYARSSSAEKRRWDRRLDAYAEFGAIADPAREWALTLEQRQVEAPTLGIEFAEETAT